MKKPSPSIHEGFVDRLFARASDGNPVADPALTAARDAMVAARRSAEKMHALVEAIQRDVTILPMVRAVKTKDLVGAAAVKAAKALDGTRAAIMAELENLRAATSAPPPPADALAALMEQEIRGKLASMDHVKRGELLANGDDQVIGAVLHAPSFLTGVSPAEVEARRDQWRRKRHADAVAREQRIEQALAVIDRSGKLLIEYASELIDGKAAAEAEQGQQAVQKAQEALAS